jgi:hypothetical protein
MRTVTGLDPVDQRLRHAHVDLEAALALDPQHGLARRDLLEGLESPLRDQSLDGCDQHRLVEVALGQGDGRLGGPHAARGGFEGRLRGVEVLTRGDRALVETARGVELVAHVLERRPRGLEVRDRGVEPELVGMCVERGEQLPGSHALARFHRHGLHPPAHLERELRLLDGREHAGQASQLSDRAARDRDRLDGADDLLRRLFGRSAPGQEQRGHQARRERPDLPHAASLPQAGPGWNAEPPGPVSS